MRSRVLLTCTVGVALALSACTPDTPSPLDPTAPSRSEKTKTIVAEVSAKGYWDRYTGYVWSVAKKGNGSNLIALPGAPGETRTINYQLDVVRTENAVVDNYGSKGRVCITTYSGVPQGLNIVGFAQYYDADADGGDGAWTIVPGVAAVVEKSGTVVGVDEYGGTITCYKYKLSMTSEPQKTVEWLGYRVFSLTFIGNLSSGEKYLEGWTSFKFPTEPEMLTGASTASLTDQFSCPAGFSCGSLPTELQSTVALKGSRSWSYAIEVKNVSAGYGAHGVRNLATLTVDNGIGSGRARADAFMEYSGGGVDASIWGCTAGYWRLPESFAHWKSRKPNDLAGNVFPASSAFTDKNGKLLSDNWLLETLHREGDEGATELDNAAMSLVREGTARLLNLAYQGKDVASHVSAVNSTLASGDRIAMLDLSGALRGQNFAGGCRLQ